MSRRETLPRTRSTAIAAALGCAALLAGLLLAGGDAEGKKKKNKGGYVAASSVQSEILDAGAITLRGKGGGKVVVRAVSGGKVLGPVARAKKGRKRAALTDAGRELLAGCATDTLSTRTTLKKKGKKKGKKKKGKKRKAKSKKIDRRTALNRDLGACSVGSENPTARPYKGPAIATPNADRCDFMDPAVCLQPFPNDHFTIADPDTDTGRRLDLDQASMPQNRVGIPIDSTDYARADGFSPGNLIVLKVPQVQTQKAFDNSGIVSIDNLRAYDDDNQPVVVIDADTGERHPIWVEVDANPLQPAIPGVSSGGSGDAGDANLIIRPARNFEEGHRYIVALRNLRDANDNPVGPPLPFRVYRDRLITQQAPVEARRSHVEDLISTLQDNGFSRANLYMTWDFTVASERSLSRRALAMRDDSLLRLGDGVAGDPIDGDEDGDDTPGDGVMQGAAPSFDVPLAAPTVPNGPGVTDFEECDPLPASCGPGENRWIRRQVVGTLTNVPCYLDAPGCPPNISRLEFEPGEDDPTLEPTSFMDDPDRDYDGSAGPNPPVSTTGVDFRCIIPHSVVDGTEIDDALGGTYGHGLLGLYTQVNGQARLADQMNSVWCAVNWAGFSQDDLGGIASSLINLSNFSQLVDRMQQGFIAFHYLGRALAHPDGFNSSDAFRIDADGSTTLESDEAVVDTDQGLFFEGISQGAIMGGALTALSPDIQRSVLNVNGMNYSTLLRRSVDFDEYAELPSVGLYASYPDQLERPLILSLMQLLWDRGETNGYAHHITGDPLANTPDHEVLMQAAFGDHQVANITAEVQARTMGARLYKPALYPGRHWEDNPFMGLQGIDFGAGGDQPFGGSALVYYDGGPETFFNDGVGEDKIECTNNPESAVPLSNTCQGSKTPPNIEIPPRPQLGYGEDPHGYPRRAVDGLTHIEQWLPLGGGILPCMDGPDMRPCYANGFTGP